MNKRKKYHTYTEEQVEYIKNIAPNNTLDGIVERFNEKFNLEQSKGSMKGVMYRERIATGVIKNSGQFEKGQEAWNKGKKGLNTGGEAGWFKSGKENDKWNPVGTEVITGKGYTIIKVAEPDVWERKHYFMYEKYNGPILNKNHLVIFADNDKSNHSKENLILITRGQLRRLHHQFNLTDDAEITKTMLNVIKLEEQISNINKDD